VWIPLFVALLDELDDWLVISVVEEEYACDEPAVVVGD
jgi:hypothetical protein